MIAISSHMMVKQVSAADVIELMFIPQAQQYCTQIIRYIIFYEALTMHLRYFKFHIVTIIYFLSETKIG